MADLTLAIPTYNEAANLGRMLPELRQAFADTDLEILIIDDASPDGTAQVATEVDPQARVVVRQERGLATAVVRGYEEAHGTWVLVMDADFQHPIDAVRRLWERARTGDADLVVGSRYVDGGSDGAFGTGRRIVSRGARLMAWLALPQVRRHRVSDPMSGLFAVRRAALDGVTLRPIGYKIILEVLARARIGKVAEVGFVFGARAAGDSKLGGGVIVQYVAHLVRLAVVQPFNWVVAAALVAAGYFLLS